jgi:hypothetical protein
MIERVADLIAEHLKEAGIPAVPAPEPGPHRGCSYCGTDVEIVRGPTFSGTIRVPLRDDTDD